MNFTLFRNVPIIDYSVRRRFQSVFYKIHRLSEDRWDPVETSTNTEQLVSNQPRSVSLHFRVTAVNNAGEGPPSATVTVVL